LCASEFETGLIGAAIFAGLLVGAVILSPLSDSWGRRPTHLLGLLFFLSGCSLMYFYIVYWSIVTACFLIGIGMYGRLVVSYLYCLELVDEGHSKVVATIAMTLNASCSGLVASYYILGGRDAES
jgi:MFS family permease